MVAGGADGGAGAGCGVVQALKTRAAAVASKLKRCIDMNKARRMWLLMMEAGAALFLLVFIVWWTASGRKPDRQVKRESAPPEDEAKR
mgnify:CR=1 FL=1